MHTIAAVANREIKSTVRPQDQTMHIMAAESYPHSETIMQGLLPIRAQVIVVILE